MDSPASLSARDAVELATALSWHVAECAGARALIIKGLTASHHGLRAERVSADADVWVSPAELGVYLEALERAGWTEREVSESVHDMVQHSVTVIHPEWPCDIDVHHAFPGFLAPAQDVFDELWSRREALRVASVEGPIVDRSSAILIAALHAMRTPAQTERHGQEVRELASRVLPSLNDAERADVVALARTTGAGDTARPVLERLGVPLPAPVPAGVSPGLDDWRERTAAQGMVTVQQWQLIRRAPWRSRPRLLWRAIWPPEQDFRLDHYEVEPGRRALNRARVARLGRGVRGLPAVVRARLAARRGVTDDSLLRRSEESS